jgi:ribosomal protein L9
LGNTVYAGIVSATMSGDPAIFANRAQDGSIIELQKSGAPVGSIGVNNTDNLFITGKSDHCGLEFTGVNIIAHKNGANPNDTIDLGSSSVKFDDVFATNGTIQTSDENEKQNITSLTSAEITAATAISKLFKTFKWKSKVAAKGDNARTHTGVIAQQVQTALTDAGLDASKYAFWCSDTWTNDDGNEQTRMGIRYSELLAFIGAATEQRLTDIETRLAALEG